MTPRLPQSAQARFARTAVALEVFLGIGALGGGIALMLGPRRDHPAAGVGARGLALRHLPRARADPVRHPGLGPLVAAGLALRRHDLAPLAACAVGLALLVWLAVEIAIVGFTMTPLLQPFYLLLGTAITAVGIAWVRSRAQRSGSAA